MDANLVRSSYAKYKISKTTDMDNINLFNGSSFKSFITYRTTLRSDFDMYYFTSVSYHSQTSSPYMITQYDSNIDSSKLLPGENSVTLCNLFPDYLSTQGKRSILRFYLLEDDKLISRRLVMELGIQSNLLENAGLIKSPVDKDVLTLSLKNREGVNLYSLDASDPKCFAQVEIQPTMNGILSAKIDASLKSSFGKTYYNIKNGEFWVKLRS